MRENRTGLISSKTPLQTMVMRFLRRLWSTPQCMLYAVQQAVVCTTVCTTYYALASLTGFEAAAVASSLVDRVSSLTKSKVEDLEVKS